MTPAERAAYKALSKWQLTAEQRRELAAHTVRIVTDVPGKNLPGLIELGEVSAICVEIRKHMPDTLPVSRRSEAAAAAMVAVAWALLGSETTP